jgi:hypothetical protein
MKITLVTKICPLCLSQNKLLKGKLRHLLLHIPTHQASDTFFEINPNFLSSSNIFFPQKDEYKILKLNTYIYIYIYRVVEIYSY